VLQASGAAPDQGSLRLLAARLLAAPTQRIAGADARLERALAAGLHVAAARVGPRRVEALARAVGLDEAALRELIRFDRALDTLPRLAAAYDRGALSRAKLMALLPLATPDTETIWLDRAERYDARALGAAARVAAGPVILKAAPRSEATDDFPVWMDATATVREALRPLGHGTDPAELAAIEIEMRESPDAARGRMRDGGEPSLFDDLESEDASVAREALLRERVAQRQSVEWRLGRLLASMRRHALHRALGHATLEDWAAAVPGLPAERVEALLAIDALLRPLPATEDAFRRGRVTWQQARLVAQASAGALPDARREREWLRRARESSLERLEALVRAQSAGGPVAAPRGITSGAPVSGSRRTATAVS
jgi:hypothetical protein